MNGHVAPWVLTIVAVAACGDPGITSPPSDSDVEDGGDGSDASWPDGDADADTDTDADADADTDADHEGDIDEPPPPDRPARYRHDQLRSPVTTHVAENLRWIYDVGESRDDLVFMKVGASETVSTALLCCFSGASGAHWEVDLAEWGSLQPTIDHFRLGDADGATPFDRESLAAEIGRTARWAQTGDPSPLDQEMVALNPAFALISYGTNDMNMGTTHRSAMWGFYQAYFDLVDRHIDDGVIPILTGLIPRSDSATAALWVPTYDAVTRGIAQGRQVPYLNLLLALGDLPDLGLSGDGLHANSYAEGGRMQPCIFTPAGLERGYNARNLLSLEVLDVVREVVLESADAPDRDDSPQLGDGSPDDPFVIDRLPFTHLADTSLSPRSAFDDYPACDSGQDESGPELLYRLELREATPLRIIVLCRDDVDIDLHLLGAAGTPESCLARDHRILQGTVAPGIYYLSLDSFVAGDGVARAGEYLFVIVPCEPGDPDCVELLG